ncbi:biotin/lipoyl-binding protein, partial [Acinetobacter baumannii]
AGQVLATLNTNALQIQAKQAQAQLKAQQEAN